MAEDAKKANQEEEVKEESATIKESVTAFSGECCRYTGGRRGISGGLYGCRM